MSAADDEAKNVAALKIQARGRGMITRKQDMSLLAESSSPNRKAEARQVCTGMLFEPSCCISRHVDAFI